VSRNVYLEERTDEERERSQVPQGVWLLIAHIVQELVSKVRQHVADDRDPNRPDRIAVDEEVLQVRD